MQKWIKNLKMFGVEFHDLPTIQNSKDLELFLEKLTTHPQILNTLSTLLNTHSQVKSALNFSFEKLWKNMQLPNKKDQERTLYMLHELQFKIHQMEKELHTLRTTKPGHLIPRPITLADSRSGDKPVSKLV